MMEFWPENQGQSSLYSKFGTIPGRNCTHNYHDRHQAAHYPLYYGEQQDQGRESSYWTVPGSRTGGAPQEYTNWTDQDLASSHFPFILDRHPPQQQDLGEYQLHEARDREWTAAQRAARDYERGFLREGWQKRWEPCSPVRYTRDVSAKRSENSYRELEAWAARYSHSLPRRRRIEAELRGASQGLSEGSRAPERDSRSGTDPRVAALQQVIQSANRESGLWERASRQHTPNYYQSQTHATDTSHMLDMKERSGYQRRMFSQPPGYIAPPPYSSPHKSSPVLHHSDTSWEQEGKRQSYWSQPTLRKQDISVDHRKGVNEDFTKPDLTQYTFPELEGPKIQRQVTDTLQASSAISNQKPRVQCEGLLSLQQPQVLPAVQNKQIEEPASKVIEGRKFRLNKKTGGMTIFCLVSRIADPTETPSLPLSTLQANIQNTELGVDDKGVTDNGGTNQTHKLADEVDFRASTIPEQPKSPTLRDPEARQTETPTCTESEMLNDNQSKMAEADVSPDRQETSDSDSALGKQAAPPVSVKYPLWREPSFSSRAENESSSPCLEARSEEQESALLPNQQDSEEIQPLDTEIKSLDAEKDTETMGNKDLLVIDTTCVVVKMELIPSPKKEHVHYVDSAPHSEHSPLDIQSSVSPECVQSSGEMGNDGITVQTAETDPLRITEIPETDLDSEPVDKKAPEGQDEISLSCLSSPPVSERETLEERAERILGIPLHDSTTEMQPDEPVSPPDSCVEDQVTETSPIKDSVVDDEAHDAGEDTTEEEQEEVGQTECLETNDTEGKEVNEDGEDFAEKLSTISEEHDHDSQLTADTDVSLKSEITDDRLLNSAKDDMTQQIEENNEPVESDTSPQHSSQCPLTDLSSSSSLSPSLDCEEPHSALSNPSSCDVMSCLRVSEEEGQDPDPIALNSTENLTLYPDSLPSHQLQSPLIPGSANFSPSCASHIDHSPSNAPPDLIHPTSEVVLSNEEEDKETGILQISSDATSDTFDVSDELESQPQSESPHRNGAEEPKTEEPIVEGVDHVIEQSQVSQNDPTDVNILQQQPECDQAEDNNTTEERAPKEVDEDPKDQIQRLEISQEGAIEVNALQQELESHTTEGEISLEVSEDPVVEQTSLENATEILAQTDANITQHQTVNCPGVDVYSLKETYLSEEQLQQETEEEHEGLLDQATSNENAADSKSRAETVDFPVIQPLSEFPDLCPPSLLDCEASSSSLDALSHSLPDESHQVDTESASLLETDSVCPSAFSLDADVPETVPPPLHHPPSVESLHVLSSSSSNSPTGLFLNSASPLSQEGSGCSSPGLPLKEEAQYPKSLWDAVNRIRKHTAPDSENEEEEVSELWDPESTGEDSGGLNVAEDMKIVFSIAEEQEVFMGGSDEDVEVGRIQRDPRHKETSRHAEEDTLSCSSGSSRGSGDTVIVAEEEETGTADNKTETERGKSRSEEKHEEEEDKSIRNESGQNEEVTNTTTEAAEQMETEQRSLSQVKV